MNVIIGGLEKTRWLERVNHETHGRIQKITLTESGRALLAEADRLALGVETRFFANLAPEELEVLTALLGKLPESPGLS